MKTLSVKDVFEQTASVARGWVQRLIRAMPRYYHTSGAKQKQRIEFWRGDDMWRPTLHIHWNWKGRGHWMFISMPEWP